MVTSIWNGLIEMENGEFVSKKVVVAMSGGVDSSVAAALLVEQGFQVEGVMLRTWESELSENGFLHSLETAQKVAQHLQVPFQVVDVRSEFRIKVIGYFIDAHEHGLTPNPCFVCNLNIKWGLLLDFALASGADKLASGHYARVVWREGEGYQLYKAVDKNKDQSYVLAGLVQSQLARAMFPLGSMTKREVREIAHSYSFPIEDEEESQDLCFLGGQNQQEFLRSFAPGLFLPGETRTLDGRVVGEHAGLALYTIGQRKGIQISHSEPYYVIAKDLDSNSLIIGTRDYLGIARVKVSDINWISGTQPALPAIYQVKVRYHSVPVEALVTFEQSSGYNISFNEPVRDPTPGQYAVFYYGDLVIGSGVITETFAGER